MFLLIVFLFDILIVYDIPEKSVGQWIYIVAFIVVYLGASASALPGATSTAGTELCVIRKKLRLSG